MLAKAYDVNYIVVDSEVEALILENNLIKKYKPKYNILMRDDKSYIMIKIEKPIKGIRDFPRIKLVREKDDPKAEYLGPYPDKLPLKNILARIRKVFPYVSCNRRLIQVSKDPLKIDTNNSIPCLYYHLGLCKAPCAGLISREEYMKDFNNIKKFLKGEKVDIVNELEKEMRFYSKETNYEKAGQIRDKIKDIRYVTQNISVDNEVDDMSVEGIREEKKENGLKELIEELGFPVDKLKLHKDFKIECYDISNIQGTNAVGAMTVMVDGNLRSDLYRKFKIQMKNEPNDFAMLQEVLTRRFSHLNLIGDSESKVTEVEELTEDTNSKVKKTATKLDPSFSIKPDLIIIDGGKGQLASTYKILQYLHLDEIIPIVGLAKREEEIFKVQWQFNNDEWPDLALKRFKRILLPRNSESLYIVQRIRDEAHRFGITFHRKLRSKQMLDKNK